VLYILNKTKMKRGTSMLIKLRKMLTNQKGFTLIELMVVIAIIGVLAAIAIPKMSSATDSAKIAKIQADLRTLGGAISVYNAQTGDLVPSAQALVDNGNMTAIPTAPSGATAYAFTAGTAGRPATGTVGAPGYVAPVIAVDPVFTSTFGGITYHSNGIAPTH
jgi:prepilin-type N-terminal cleavage/methylation domain-containing protein